ncbi:MAG: Uncharacterized protein G01um101418_463 [Parcubacteria group bacterium Gr01-1014_18]|nr:MAG: Uncharacterized protein Greene041636_509 [Parcubacteria group bacterium Greene0416_36]TSC81050.1 MAG: Uncharacterized protein G01um101418_463 [Parcubacteria group bacterium Gr01-1014_18]TSC98784.1 MAG: Uncharacterized protein Greene101420_534 [Parcubacteria group bacterium Greene1014_20]TSD06736.1 MAG: Uncharacterized protein Greene07142_657 [Parcubacteria group bacterium Greene0714_2]
MKKHLPIALSLGALIFLADIPVVSASSECYYDPVYQFHWKGMIKSGVRMRTGACISGTDVIEVLPGGKKVDIIGEIDGWYKVQVGDQSGWVGATFIDITEETGGQSDRFDGEYSRPEKNNEIKLAISELFFSSAPVTVTPAATPKSIATTAPVPTNLSAKLKGKILLDVENNGEAWYVHPITGLRYYLRDGSTAYQLMRRLSLGISSTDFVRLEAGDSALNARLRGKIILEVENKGKAWYIHPDNGGMHYLADGDAAYQLMRNLSLGITRANLDTISTTSLSEETTATPTATPHPSNSSVPIVSVTIEASSFQEGVIPAGIDTVALNQYWLGKINALRAEKGLRFLTLDQRWINTASEWSAYMGKNDQITHDRPDGKTMHQWIDTKGLPFTVRNSFDGWKTNYFTENISWNIISGTQESAKGALEDTLQFYLSEAAANGPHYRTIYHADWNSVGSGFYFQDLGDGSYKIYMTFHYGSLVR